ALAIEIQRAIRRVDGAHRVAELLAHGLADHEDDLELLVRLVLELDQILHHADDELPLAELRVEPLQRVEELPIERLDLPRLFENARRFFELVGPASPDLARLHEELEALVTVWRVARDIDLQLARAREVALLEINLGELL